MSTSTQTQLSSPPTAPAAPQSDLDIVKNIIDYFNQTLSAKPWLWGTNFADFYWHILNGLTQLLPLFVARCNEEEEKKLSYGSVQIRDPFTILRRDLVVQNIQVNKLVSGLNKYCQDPVAVLIDPPLEQRALTNLSTTIAGKVTILQECIKKIQSTKPFNSDKVSAILESLAALKEPVSKAVFALLKVSVNKILPIQTFIAQCFLLNQQCFASAEEIVAKLNKEQNSISLDRFSKLVLVGKLMRCNDVFTTNPDAKNSATIIQQIYDCYTKLAKVSSDQSKQYITTLNLILAILIGIDRCRDQEKISSPPKQELLLFINALKRGKKVDNTLLRQLFLITTILYFNTFGIQNFMSDLSLGIENLNNFTEYSTANPVIQVFLATAWLVKSQRTMDNLHPGEPPRERTRMVVRASNALFESRKLFLQAKAAYAKTNQPVDHEKIEFIAARLNLIESLINKYRWKLASEMMEPGDIDLALAVKSSAAKPSEPVQANQASSNQTTDPIDSYLEQTLIALLSTFEQYFLNLLSQSISMLFVHIEKGNLDAVKTYLSTYPRNPLQLRNFFGQNCSQIAHNLNTNREITYFIRYNKLLPSLQLDLLLFDQMVYKIKQQFSLAATSNKKSPCVGRAYLLLYAFKYGVLPISFPDTHLRLEERASSSTSDSKAVDPTIVVKTEEIATISATQQSNPDAYCSTLHPIFSTISPNPTVADNLTQVTWQGKTVDAVDLTKDDAMPDFTKYALTRCTSPQNVFQTIDSVPPKDTEIYGIMVLVNKVKGQPGHLIPWVRVYEPTTKSAVILFLEYVNNYSVSLEFRIQPMLKLDEIYLGINTTPLDRNNVRKVAGEMYASSLSSSSSSTYASSLSSLSPSSTSSISTSSSSSFSTLPPSLLSAAPSSSSICASSWSSFLSGTTSSSSSSRLSSLLTTPISLPASTTTDALP